MGLKRSHRVGRWETNNVHSTMEHINLPGWVDRLQGVLSRSMPRCLLLYRYILADASFAWPGETLCEHNHRARTSGSHCVTATSITAATAETRQIYHRGSIFAASGTAHITTTVAASGMAAIWHGCVYVNGFSTG